MTKLGSAIVESILARYGRSELLARLADPYWFQALGPVMGMDWKDKYFKLPFDQESYQANVSLGFR
jgi:hypothetical protein